MLKDLRKLLHDLICAAAPHDRLLQDAKSRGGVTPQTTARTDCPKAGAATAANQDGLDRVSTRASAFPKEMKRSTPINPSCCRVMGR